MCQFGLMFLPNQPRALREMYRVLGAGGYAIFNTWDSLAANHLAEVAGRTVASLFTGAPPELYQVPFSSHDVGHLRQPMTTAGFSEVRSETLGLPGESVTAEGAATGRVRQSDRR